MSNSSPQPAAASEALLEIRDLWKAFPLASGLLEQLRFEQGRLVRKRESVKAINGVSLDIRRGEALCVVGESGCGKSELALVEIDSAATRDAANRADPVLRAVVEVDLAAQVDDELAVDFSTCAPRFGELIVFRQHGALIVHRCLGRARRGGWRSRGDGVPAFDPAVSAERLVGRVVAARLDGVWRAVVCASALLGILRVLWTLRTCEDLHGSTACSASRSVWLTGWK